MRFVLQTAQRVRHALDGVLDGVRKVVHRIDAPLVACLMMVLVQDAVQRRIAHVDVGRGHVDLGTQRSGAVLKLAVLHAHKQIEVLLDAAFTIGAVAPRLRERAAVLAHLVLGQIVHIGKTLADELERQFIALIEVGGTKQELVPLEAQPVNILHDGIDVLGVLLCGVRVIEAKIAAAAVLLRHAKIDGQSLGVPNVQISVGLGRKTRLDTRFLVAHILLDGFLNEILNANVFFHTLLLYCKQQSIIQ